jgi:hypothetical protein
MKQRTKKTSTACFATALCTFWAKNAEGGTRFFQTGLRIAALALILMKEKAMGR